MFEDDDRKALLMGMSLQFCQYFVTNVDFMLRKLSFWKCTGFFRPSPFLFNILYLFPGLLLTGKVEQTKQCSTPVKKGPPNIYFLNPPSPISDVSSHTSSQAKENVATYLTQCRSAATAKMKM